MEVQSHIGNSTLVWQNMSIKFFAMMLGNDSVTLQLFSGKSSWDEPTDYSDLFIECYGLNERIQSTSILLDSIKKKIISAKKYTYLSCFYRQDAPIANLLTMFGRDCGVSVAFDRSKLITAIKTHYDNVFLMFQKSGIDETNMYWGDLCYDREKFVAMLKSKIDIKKFASCRSSDIEFRELYRELLYYKSTRFEDEKEFRLVLEWPLVDPRNYDTPETYRIDGIADSILSVAISKGKNMETITKALVDYYGYNIDEEKTNPIDPLAIYKLKKR